MSELIITAAVVGAETMKEHNPAVPYTPVEIADEAKRCRDAGASMVHVHGRNDDGSPTQDRDTFSKILNETRTRSDILVQFSTGGAVWMDVEERIEGLDLKPDMATLTTGTVNFGDEVFMNSWPMIVQIATRLQELGIKPELEIFDTGMIDNALRLLQEGLISEPLHFDFVLGVPGGAGGHPELLDFMVGMIPDGSTWSVAGVGRHELPLAFKAVDMGGHVRVGLEDNIYVAKGELAEGSWQLVEKVVDYATSKGRDISTPDLARSQLSL